MRFWCYVVIGLIFFLISFGIPALGQSSNNLAGFKTWTRSSDSLPIATRQPNVVYDVSFDPNTIWIVGMQQCTTCVSKYDINNDSIISYYTLNNGGWSYGNPSVVFINGIVYYFDNNGVLYSYNVITNAETTVTTFSVSQPCLTKHPNGGQLYVAHGNGGNAFYVYDFASGTGGFTSGPSMKYGTSRTSPTCVVNDYTDTTYLYIIGGDSSYIERIDINILNKWETLTTRLTNEIGGNFDFDSSQIRHMAPISYLNYIILLGGWDGNSEDDIIALNVVTLDITYLGTYPEVYRGPGAVLAHNRIYSFGGYQSTSYSNDIIYTNEQIPPTLEPSNQPSTTPTFDPTTLTPSYNPSVEPSTTPTSIPSIVPSQIPSNIPSKFPSDAPIDLPLDTPAPSENLDGLSIVLDTTSIPKTSKDVSESRNNNKSNGLSSTQFTIIVITAILSVCCIIISCMFSITILSWSKQQSLNREIAMKQLTMNNINNGERVPLQNGNDVGVARKLNTIGNQPQVHKLLSISLANNNINNNKGGNIGLSDDLNEVNSKLEGVNINDTENKMVELVERGKQ